jgi:hypothetical protein
MEKEDREYLDNLVADLLDNHSEVLETHLKNFNTGKYLSWQLQELLPDLPGHISYDDWIQHLKAEADKYRRRAR